MQDHMAANVAWDQDAPIFSTPTGRRVRPSNWRHKVWQPAIKKSGLPENGTPYVLLLLLENSVQRVIPYSHKYLSVTDHDRCRPLSPGDGTEPAR